MEGLSITINPPSEEEKKWVKMLADGKSYKEIAIANEMNKNTFAYKITSLRERFNCENSNELVAFFLRNKLIE